MYHKLKTTHTRKYLRNTASEINTSQIFRTRDRIPKNWSIGRHKIHHPGWHTRLPTNLENRPIRQQCRITRFPQYSITLQYIPLLINYGGKSDIELGFKTILDLLSVPVCRRDCPQWR